MRLFIAFEVPDDVSNQLFEVQKRLQFSGKATKTKTFHLTLKFLGEVDEKKISILKDELSKVKFAPFEASLSDVGAFPDADNPRVVWVGLEPHDKINEIQRQVDTATQKLGFEQDKKFHPHLTLARIKFVDNRKELKDCIASLKVPEASFTLDSFKLIKSTLTPRGPVYEVLETFTAQQ
ncbi:RNA 2',3'-cyclic phosphodiesterase [Candidatus Woesearchaeota archaeon]|nr:RNA 2',3'-cyclic phosphodiesterase [Candidatus Woesearchaeota archaeon]